MPLSAVANTWDCRLLPGRLRIAVPGLKRSPALAGHLIRNLQSTAGITAVTANPLTGRALIYFCPESTGLDQIVQSIRTACASFAAAGTGVEPPREHSARTAVREYLPTVQAAYALAAGGVLTGLALKRIALGRSPLAASPHVFNLAALVTIVSGYPIFRRGIDVLTHKKRINSDLILFMATLILLAMRESIAGLSVLWIVHMSNLFQQLMQAKARRAIDDIARNKRTDCACACGRDDAEAGGIVRFHSGERITVDGSVAGGRATVNEAALSGRCIPVMKQRGDPVAAGSLILAGALKIRAENVGENTSAARMARLAAQARPPAEECDSVVLRKMTGWTISIAGIVFLLTRDVARSLAILLAGCPAAVASARCAALGTAAAAAASQGIFVKNAACLESAGEARTVLFDKTGTLTTEAPVVADIVVLDDRFQADDILAYAASGQKPTAHPLARTLVAEARRRGIRLVSGQGELMAGKGVKAQLEGRIVLTGSELFMRENGVAIRSGRARALRLTHFGSSVLYVAVDGKLAGLIGIRDVVRPESRTAVVRLRTLGIQNIGLVTGDTAQAAETAAAELGITRRWGGVSPEEKAAMVQTVRQQSGPLIMVGDGTNDSAALAASDVGVAMGLAGTDAAIVRADVVIADDDPRKVAELVAIGKHAHEVIHQNLSWAIGFNIVGISLAVARLLSPVMAGLLLNAGTLAVVFNSARLLPPKRKPAVRPALGLQHFADGQDLPSRPSVPDASVAMPVCWTSLPREELCRNLAVSAEAGISEAEAGLRRLRTGNNELAEKPRPGFLRLFLNQFNDYMVQVLLAVAALSAFLGKFRDAVLTMVIVMVNAALGVAQEKRAEQSIFALRRLSSPKARVIRDGKIRKVRAAELVPGDLIILEAGDRVPADARLLTASHFEVEEASLTGETVPVKKLPDFVGQPDTALGDRRNMVFMGTGVTRGRATAAVVATGMATEMGKIAALIQQHGDQTTPLQTRLDELGRYMVSGCLGISALVFFAGLLRGAGMLQMMQTAASLAVAAIPEGLTAIVVIALAMGVQRMSRRNIVVRKLAAIETLGCATVICTDKTGTLTQNQMTVREIYTPGQSCRVTGEGYAPEGRFLHGGPTGPDADISRTLLIGTLCSNAVLIHDKSPGQARKVVEIRERRSGAWRIDGDPTEGAIVVAAAKAGIWQNDLARNYERVREFPFESERRMMSVVCRRDNGETILYVKGAPDRVLAACTHYFRDGQVWGMDDVMRREILRNNDDMTGRALRVLACAFRTGEVPEEEDDAETGLTFCGLVGMIDPPRPEVPTAIAKCQEAGVKVVMITGDHPNTAWAIASELGLLRHQEKVVLGQDIDGMSDTELEKIAPQTAVYARTSPQHKLRIVKALKRCGYIVAMTGDGVNDAPAVKVADIGIAMGMTGTDVTKEASGMTLTDDNFATIVHAMEEGRSIYANIRKAIRYLVATNLGEVVLMLLAVLLGLPLPLIPIQLLWINLVGDGLPAVALVNDPPSGNIMKQCPRTADNRVFSGGLGRKVLLRGLIIGTASLALYAWKLLRTGSVFAARTLVLTELAISQFFHLFDCRIEQETGKVGLGSNPWLIGAVALSMLMIAGVAHCPALRPMFGTAPLTASDWGLALAFGAGTSLADLALEGMLDRRSACLSLPAPGSA